MERPFYKGQIAALFSSFGRGYVLSALTRDTLLFTPSPESLVK